MVLIKTNKPCGASQEDTVKVDALDSASPFKKSRITHWWVVHQETMCRLTQLDSPPKDNFKAYTPVNDSAGHNVAM